MGNFCLKNTFIEDLVVIEPKVFGDNRGYFMETYNYNDFKKLGLNMIFVQDNQSKSKQGVLRGMHFQKNHSQGKLVRVIKGEVFDVGIDLRKNSKTYGKWYGEFLSEDNKKQMYIPEGFAHGFLVVSDEAVFNYKCTDYYAPEFDSGLLWNDPEVGVEWPLDGIEEILLSEKDKVQKTLKELDIPFEYKGE